MLKASRLGSPLAPSAPTGHGCCHQSSSQHQGHISKHSSAELPGTSLTASSAGARDAARTSVPQALLRSC